MILGEDIAFSFYIKLDGELKKQNTLDKISKNDNIVI